MLNVGRSSPGTIVMIMMIAMTGILASDPAIGEGCISRQELTARAAGIVARYVAANDQKVEKGAVIVEFDDRMVKAAVMEAEAAVEGAKASVGLAQDAVTRLKKLRPGETVSRQNIVEAQLKLAQAKALQNQAEAALERVRVQYADTKIHADIAGTVRGLPSVIGLAVQAGQSLGRIEADAAACRAIVPNKH